MGFRESTIVGSMLLAISFLAGADAPAMEPMQPGAPSASAPALPSFLDEDNLPALQEAWRTYEPAPDPASPGSQPREAPQSIPSATPAADAPVPNPMRDPMATARAAIERANRPGHDDASVRRRAEELSRRFSLGGEPPASEIEAGRPSVMIPPAAVPPVIIPPAVVPPAVVPEASLKPGKTIVKPNPPTRTNSVTVPVTTGAVAPPEVQPLDASVRTQSAMATERLRLAAPPPPRVDLPPLPKRAPKVRSLRAAAEAPGTATKAAITRARPARSYSSSQSPSDPRAALRGTVMTNQLRAFGWNNQPD